MPLLQIQTLLASSKQDDRSLQFTIDDLQQNYGDQVYPAVFQALYNIELSVETARFFWQEATRDQFQLNSLRSLRATLLDYLYTRTNELLDPRVIDAHKLDKLRLSAVTDGLTHLYNQSHFKQELGDLISKYNSMPGATFSLLLFDLDHFKQFNDRSGHLRGDRVLADVGQIISSLVPAGALAARYGGEEFAVILPDTGLTQSIILADKIRSTIEQTRFDGEERLDKGNLTISGGVACYPAAGKSMVALVAHADSKLYDAKVTRNSISPKPSDSRGIIRHAIRNIVELRSTNNESFKNSLSADISYTGMLLKTDRAPTVGNQIELRFPYPFWPSEHLTTAQVRHVRSNATPNNYLIGIEFTEPQVDFIERILPSELYSPAST
ncbi:MAG TPA: diguanylate cyclase [Malonomonas sp.]